jgi:DNA relaxase NicK
LDALLHPTQHFLAAYPCFHAFDNETAPVKFEMIKKAAEITWEKAISITRHQFGKYYLHSVLSMKMTAFYSTSLLKKNLIIQLD